MVFAFVLAVALRWLVILRYYRDLPLGLTDNFFYHQAANLLAEGHGFINPFAFYGNPSDSIPTAGHPPLYSMLLAAWSWFGADTALWHRLASGLVSATAVIPVVLLVNRLAGRPAAIFAGFGVAFYPPLWMNDGLILSESLYIPLAAGALLAAQRVADNPSYQTVIVLSAVLAAGALTRSEALLVFFTMLLGLVLTRTQASLAIRLKWLLAASAVALLIMAPWVVRNMIAFEETTFLTAGPGYVMELGNCDLTYSGMFLGYWHKDCDQNPWPTGDESVVGAHKLSIAQDYILDHINEVPKVVAARVGRLFGVFRPFQNADFDVFFERRVRSHVQLGLWAHWGVSLCAVAGAVILRRRGETLWPTLGMVTVAVLTAAASFGITRYRVGADVALLVLASVAVGTLADRWWPKRDSLAKRHSSLLPPNSSAQLRSNASAVGS